jgi:CheY-specific phosphatase CheX
MNSVGEGASVDTPTELVDALSEAVPFALREMAGAEVVLRADGPATAADAAGGVSAQIRLTAAAGVWALILNLSDRTAAELARRILTGTPAEVDEGMMQDCAGEVANVVAGQAKALLVGTPLHFTLSTPTVAQRCDPGDGHRVLRFDSDAGAFAIHLVRG